jgi:hypothetical protein
MSRFARSWLCVPQARGGTAADRPGCDGFVWINLFFDGVIPVFSSGIGKPDSGDPILYENTTGAPEVRSEQDGGFLGEMRHGSAELRIEN